MLHVRWLKPTAKDKLSIEQSGAYSLPSALADGHLNVIQFPIHAE